MRRPETLAASVRSILRQAGPDVTDASYGAAKLERLRAIKRAWDPTNVFRLSHNVEPATD